MAQHAAPAPGRTGGAALTPTTAAVVVPLLTGLAYGLWAATIQRDGGEVTGGNIALGFGTGILVAALCLGIHQWSKQQAGQHFLTRSLTWSTFAGVSIGFLHSLVGTAILWSVVLGLIIAGSTAVATYYRYYSASEYAPV